MGRTEQQVVVPSLVRWGLSADADLLYRVLVALGPRTSTHAARELGLAVRRVRRALDELAAVSAARPTSRIRSSGAEHAEAEWVPAPVERVLAAIRLRRRPDTVAERWRRHLAAVDGIDRFSLDTVAVRHHVDRATARRRIAQLSAAARHEQLSLNTEEVLTPDVATAALPLDGAMRVRGLRLRSVGLAPGDGDRAYGRLGDEYREVDSVPIKLMIYDRQVALFPADPLDFDAGAIEVSDPAMVEQFCAVFHRFWAAGRDPRRTGVRPVALTRREKAIVARLAYGHSEAAAAADLGMSRRTVIYSLRGLMDRLGVENRFQLALILGATGTAMPPGFHGDKEKPCGDKDGMRPR